MYSLDTKIIVVNLYKKFQNCRIVAKLTSISRSTISRWINLDSLEPKIRINKKRKLTSLVIDYIKKSIKSNPFLTLSQTQNKINKKFSINIALSTIFNAYRLLNISYKKVTKRYFKISIRNYKSNVNKFRKDVSKINKDDIISIDECAIYKNSIKEYGRTSHKRLLSFRKIRQNTKTNLLMAINNKQIIAYQFYEKPIKTDNFNEFLKTNILDKYTNKYLLMDNATIHKTNKGIDQINKSNNYPLFIPPYSPQLNPIEEVFSKIKNTFRRLNTKSPSINFLNKIQKSFKSISQKDLTSYYAHSF